MKQIPFKHAKCCAQLYETKWLNCFLPQQINIFCVSEHLGQKKILWRFTDQLNKLTIHQTSIKKKIKDIKYPENELIERQQPSLLAIYSSHAITTMLSACVCVCVCVLLAALVREQYFDPYHTTKSTINVIFYQFTTAQILYIEEVSLFI